MAVKFMLSSQRSGTHFLKSIVEHAFDTVECTGEVLRDQGPLSDKYTALPSKPSVLYFWPWYQEKVKSGEISAFPDARMLAFVSYIQGLADSVAPKDLLVDVKYNSVRSLSGYWDSEYGSKDFVDPLALGGVPVVHLIRRNILRMVISNKLAQETGIWHRTAERAKDEPLPKLKLKPKELLGEVQYHSKVVQDYTARLVKANRVDQVFYEGLVDEVENRTYGPNVELLCKFLGFTSIDFAKVSSNFKKTTPQDLNEVVENWDEIKSMFLRTELGWMAVK